MSDQKPYQVHIFLREEFAEAVSRGRTPKEVQPLLDVSTAELAQAAADSVAFVARADQG